MTDAREAAEKRVTPAEIASEMVDAWFECVDHIDCPPDAADNLKDAITAALLAERKAERERCAKVAEDQLTNFAGHFGDDWASGHSCAARNIAAAIRREA